LNNQKQSNKSKHVEWVFRIKTQQIVPRHPPRSRLYAIESKGRSSNDFRVTFWACIASKVV